MAKLQLVANPTFDADVGIPVAGGDTVPVRFTFKHRTKKELNEWSAAFIKSVNEKPDVEALKEMALGWNLEEEFNDANIALLLENHIGAGLATYHAYCTELQSARIKN